MTNERSCPKCGADVSEADVECSACGVVLAKARDGGRSQTPPPAPEPVAVGVPAVLSSPYKLRRGETDYDVPNLETLREWARAGRVAPSDYVYNPTLERWAYARDLAELEGELRVATSQRKSQDYRKHALACFIAALVTAIWAPQLSGLLLLIAIVLLVVNYAR